MFDTDDISADITASIKSLNEGDGGLPAAPAESATVVTETPAEPAHDRNRDEQGRFAPKGAEEATAAKPAEQNAKPEGEQPEPQAPKPETIRPPASWSAAAKAEFAQLPPLIQQEVLKRESDIERGKTEFQDRATRLNRFESVLEPYRTEIQLAGVDEATYVSRLFAAEKVLRENPDYGFRYLAQLYGFDLSRLAGQPQPGTAPQPAAVHPQFMGLQNEVSTLKQQLDAQRAADEERQLSAARAQVEAFAKDNIYFENVRDDVHALLSAGRAKDLKDAYDQAVWANPETRKLMLADQTRKAEADAIEARRKQAEQARRAGGSLAGSSAGAPAPSGGSDNIEDDVRAAFRAAGGRA